MDTLLLIFNIILGFFLAFQAGQMKAMIDIDKIEGRKPEKRLYFFLIADSIISLYLIISIYGAGIRHG